jgi:hypothetical protein
MGRRIKGREGPPPLARRRHPLRNTRNARPVVVVG